MGTQRPVGQRFAWLDDGRVAFALFLVLALVQLRGALHHWELYGGRDWNTFAGQAQAEVTTIVRDGRFPLWNPWRSGGQVSYAQPESMILTPVTLLALLFGVTAAFKLLLVPIFVFGAFGAWKLARALGLTGAAALVPPLVLFGANTFPLYVAGGFPNWLFGLALLPWLGWALIRACDDLRWSLLAGLLWACVLFAGDVYHFVFFPLLLGVWLLALAVQRRSVSPVLAGAGAVLAGGSLVAVKLAPLLDVFSVYARQIPVEGRFLPLSMLWRVFVDPWVPDLLTPGSAFVKIGDAAGNWVYWHDAGSYVGPVPALLVGLALLAAWRRSWPIALMGGVFAWLSLGLGVHPSLWQMLHAVPVLGSMRAPERLVQGALFAVALLAGLGAARLLARLPSFAGPLLLLAVTVPLVLAATGIADTAFIVRPSPRLPPPAAFQQSDEVFRVEQFGGELQEAVLSNRGNPKGGSRDLPTPVAVRPSNSPAYRGETWLVGGHGTLQSTLAPGLIRVHAELSAPDRLMVNQNWFPGWVAEGLPDGTLPAEATEHLLSWSLPAGSHDLVLRFTQPWVLRGLLLSLAAALVGVLYLRAAARRVPLASGSPRRAELAAALAFGAIASLQLAGHARPPVEPEAGAVESRTIELDLGPGDDPRVAQTLATATAGDVVLLHAGPGGAHLGALRLERGVALLAVGDVTAGPLVISHVPWGEQASVVGLSLEGTPAADIHDCAGSVILQSCRLHATAGMALRVGSANRVTLLAGEVESDAAPAAGLQRTALVVHRTRIASGPGGAAIAARDTRLLLDQASVAGGSAVLLMHSRMVATSSGAETLRGATAQPVLTLRSGSRAELSSVPLVGGAPDVGPDCVLSHAAPPRPVVRIEPVPERHLLRITVRAGADRPGMLVIGESSLLEPVGRPDALLQVAPESIRVSVPLTLHAGEEQTLEQRVPADMFRPGAGWFVQVAAGTPDAGGYVGSLLAAGLYDPGAADAARKP